MIKPALNYGVTTENEVSCFFPVVITLMGLLVNTIFQEIITNPCQLLHVNESGASSVFRYSNTTSC